MVADFSKKQKGEFSGNKLALQAAGIFFLIIIIILIVADFKIYQKKKELLLQINSYKKQIADIKNSSQNLKNEIANSNNQDYIEKVAYEQLGQQKPGEKEIIFTTPTQKTAPAAISNSKNFWDVRLWWNWLKSKL